MSGGPEADWGPEAAREMGALLHRSRRGLKALDRDAGKRLWTLYRAAVAAAAGPRGRRGPGAGAPPFLVLEAYGRLYRAPGPSGRGLWEALAGGIPRAVRAEARWVLSAAVFYAAVAAVAALAVAHSPAWASALLPGSIRAHLQSSHGRAAVAPDPALVVMLFFHNAAASGAAYAGGIFAGLGSAAALAVNAALLGALAGWAAAHGEQLAFWSLIAPHGVLELPATFCAGGGGLAMGWAWLSPGERSRAQALLAAFRRTAPLFGACVAWLIGAACIEGLFTPQPLPPVVKLLAAAVLLAAFLLYLLRGGHGAAPVPAAATGAAAAVPPPAPPRPLVGRGAGPSPRARAPKPTPPSGIRLPEGLFLPLQPAAVPTRALALVIDTAILAAMAALCLLGARAVLGSLPGDWAAAIEALLAALFLGLYGFLFEWLGGGATPGKQALRLAVLRDDGRPAGVVPALVRNVMRAIDFLPALYLLGTAAALGSGGSRRLGDWAAGTMVVHLPRPPAAPRRRSRSSVPLPRPRDCGPLPEAATLRRLPSGLRRRAARLWRRGPGGWGGAPAVLQRLGTVPGCEGLAAAPVPAALEHLMAGLDRAGLLRGRRYAAAPPRDRAADLEPRAPGRAALEQVPDALAAAVQSFWSRLPAIEGPHRAAVAQRLAARLAEALGAPGLDRPDPDALVEHVAYLLGHG